MKLLKNMLLCLSLITAFSTISVADSTTQVNKDGDRNVIDLKKFDWSKITQEEARETLAKHIDAAKIPHGDLAISSDAVHSKRYIISQWQRVAAGAVVVVLSHDSEGNLVIALGSQRGNLVPPQGYMEARLPKDDLTGLRAKSASRINGSTNEIVKADRDLEENAVREVKEELGLDINEKNLILIDVLSSEDENPIVSTVAAQYTVMIDKPTALRTIDEEFIEDDMQSPKWLKVKDISCAKEGCSVDGEKLLINLNNVTAIQKAVKHFVDKSNLEQYSSLMNFKIGN